MIRNQALPFLGECYADEARPFSSQDVCNWLPAAAEKPGTLTPEMAQTPPGLSPFVEIPGTGGGETAFIPSKPVRGTYNCEGKLFAVIGNVLYQIANNGAAIPIGAIPGVTRTRFAHNQITNGNQLVTVNGSAGYVYDTPTQVFERITDPGYPGAITADFVDGYIVSIEPGRRFAFNSDLANAHEYNTLDRFTSEYKPDLLVTQVVSNNELILLSESSGEVFYNSGASQQPFRTKRVFFDKGCSGRCNAAVIDNSFVFHSSDGMFYLYEGGIPKRISPRPIEQAVAGLNWSQGFAEVWIDGGHSVVYWTFPGGHTWGWDASSGKWHRRASYGMDRWRANTLTKWKRSAPGKRDEWIAGDFQTGRLWRVDWDYLLEGDQEFVSEIVGVVLSDNQNPLTMPRLEVMLDTGQELTVPREFPPQPPPTTPGPTISGHAPDGMIGQTYTGYTYTVTGDDPLAVEVVSGALPPGLGIGDSGTISPRVTPSQGTFPFTLQVTDGYGRTATLDDSISILYGSPLAVGSIGFFSIYSGATSAYPLAQSLTFGSESATSVSATEGGSYVARASANSPYFRLFKQNELGAYTEVPTPLDTMPSATLERVALTSDGAYLATAQGTTWRLYKKTGDTFDLVQTVTGLTQCMDLKWTGDSEYLAGSSFTGVKVFRRSGDVLTLLTYAGSVGSAGIAWYGYRLAHAAIGDNQGVRVASVAGDTITTLANATFSSPELALIRWSLDGQTLFMGGNSSGNRLRVYQWSGVAFSARTDPTEQPTDQIKSMDLSADGRVLSATCGENGAQIRVYAVSGQSLALLSVVGADADTESASATFLDSSVHWT